MEPAIRLLYVEDDMDWASTIKTFLETEGFTLQIAGDGEAAGELFAKEPFDMILLDVCLPGKNGWELIRSFRQINEWVPVVMYTSAFEIESFAEAFGLGAEDYISKGTAPEVFSMRLKALYHRFKEKQSAHGNIRLSPSVIFTPASGLLCISGEHHFLKTNEATALELLSRNLGKETGKKELCEKIWGKGTYSEAKETALKNIIVVLRKYFTGTDMVIKNKRWGGYYLTPS